MRIRHPKPVNGRVKLMPFRDEPLFVALAHFANRAQECGYCFSEKDRGVYESAVEEAKRLRRDNLGSAVTVSAGGAGGPSVGLPDGAPDFTPSRCQNLDHVAEAMMTQ